MITLRCTKRLLKYYGFAPDAEDRKPTATLGDWYANLIGTISGDLVIFVNETSRLSVALPAGVPPNELAGQFRSRVQGLLRRLALPCAGVEREMFQLMDIKIGKTKSRSILGALTQVSYLYEIEAERQKRLSETEISLARFIHLPLKARYPVDVARDLLAAGRDSN
jgi:hypothetical protein